MILTDDLKPGDLLLTRTTSYFGKWIRRGAAMSDLPNLVNHVIIVRQRDKVGKQWGIEGRPGGAGWVVITDDLMRNPYTMNNCKQAKTSDQRKIVCEGAVKFLGTEYDWQAIVGDALDALHKPNPWDDLWEEGYPSHVVCSSAADYLYEQANLEAPIMDRNCKPGDWAKLWIERGWA
jgi:hypothetical protein